MNFLWKSWNISVFSTFPACMTKQSASPLYSSKFWLFLPHFPLFFIQNVFWNNHWSLTFLSVFLFLLFLFIRFSQKKDKKSALFFISFCIPAPYLFYYRFYNPSPLYFLFPLIVKRMPQKHSEANLKKAEAKSASAFFGNPMQPESKFLSYWLFFFVITV